MVASTLRFSLAVVFRRRQVLGLGRDVRCPSPGAQHEPGSWFPSLIERHGDGRLEAGERGSRESFFEATHTYI